MRTVKLNGRYNAYRKYGYKYSLELHANEWRKYFDLKKVVENMFGPSVEMVRRYGYMWKDDVALLKTAPWAYHYEVSRKPTFIYFREERDLEQAVMMWALTNHEINN